MTAIKVQDLTVKYGDKTAVDRVSFEVEEGEVFGFLGPNGAGKTSTIKATLGLLDYTGVVKIMGLSPESTEVKNLVGYVPENSMLIEHLTPLEFFEFTASVRRLDTRVANERLESLISAFDIAKFVNQPIASLSAGTRQKVTVIAALLHEPPILILDEPFNGLDAKSTRLLKEIISRHVKRGGSVLFSTHILEIAEKLCDRFSVIDKGRIIAEGTIEELRELSAGEDLEDIFLRLTGQYGEIKEVLNGLS
jgi:ABC-2 type transport system ATP-binding protein